MFEDSDEESSELEIQSRTWKKLENQMKLVGFREGAAKGKFLSMQEGFNLGYSDGFKLGEYIGMCKGVTRSELELDIPVSKKSNFDMDILDKMSKEACVLCLHKESNKPLTKAVPSDVKDLISSQQTHCKELLKTLEESDMKFFEKR